MNGEFRGPKASVILKLDGVHKPVHIDSDKLYTVKDGQLYDAAMEPINIGGIIWEDPELQNDNVKKVLSYLTPRPDYSKCSVTIAVAQTVDHKDESVIDRTVQFVPFNKHANTADGKYIWTGRRPDGTKSCAGSGFTVGKIYEVKNGATVDDDGDIRPQNSKNRWDDRGEVERYGFMKVVE